MSRVIKFRAWDPETKQLTSGKSIKESCEISRDLVHWYWDDNIILMQFTGITDKNGKEIYEGDIVNAIENGMDDSFNKTDEILSEAKAVVYWNNEMSGWSLQSEQFMEAFTPMAHLDSYEVIGNIYQHPELLTA